ncbi:MAG: RNA polymerase sigma factor [Cyclobacteriaceae bacterium]
MSGTTPDSMQDRFVTVVECHRGIIYKVVHAYCHDHDDREDLAQEIIFQLWRSFEKYDSQYKLSTWMYRIALNVAISHHRKRTVRDRHHLPLDVGLLQVSEEPPPDLGEEVKLLRQYIRELNRVNKSLMLLYLDGNSYQEIAEVLDISITNVGTRLNRLKKQLKEQLTKALK